MRSVIHIHEVLELDMFSLPAKRISGQTTVCIQIQHEPLNSQRSHIDTHIYCAKYCGKATRMLNMVFMYDTRTNAVCRSFISFSPNQRPKKRNPGLLNMITKRIILNSDQLLTSWMPYPGAAQALGNGPSTFFGREERRTLYADARLGSRRHSTNCVDVSII